MTYLRMNHFLKLRTPPAVPATQVETPALAPAEAPKTVPVSKVKRRHVALAACAILASGCGRDDPVAHNGQPTQVATNHGPIPQAFARDPSVPDASEVFAAQAAIVPQPAATPEKKMTKDEESKAMPMAGQANNHSAPVPAKTVGK
jgi:hypothetical protein